jgi:hypothetical protein
MGGVFQAANGSEKRGGLLDRVQSDNLSGKPQLVQRVNFCLAAVK